MTELGTITEQNSNLVALSNAGVSIWLDDLSRDRISSGNLQHLIDTRSVVGVTTNPSIFQTALSTGTAYDARVRELSDTGADVETIVHTITTDDVRDACDLFEPMYLASGGIDGRVSIEVDPRVANDTDNTIEQALELSRLVDRPNVLVKIPATDAGISAISQVIGRGISVNVTLIFSVERYEAVLDAYLDGLDIARSAGLDLSTIHSVASFFVSRVDAEVDSRLDTIGTPQALVLKGSAAVANARLAYSAYQRVFEVAPRFQSLCGEGTRPQRPLWASTGVKDPSLSDTTYVTELVGPNTVNTMPEKTLQAFADHGTVTGDTLSGTTAHSQAVFDQVAELGIDVTDMFLTVENDGVRTFEVSWGELLETTAARLHERRSAAHGS